MPDLTASLAHPRSRVVVALIVGVTVVSIAGMLFFWSPDPPGNTLPDQVVSTSPSPTASPIAMGSPSAVATPSASTAVQPSAGNPGPQNPPTAKPVVSNLNATPDGFIVTVTFTVQAQPERGPFTCRVNVIYLDPRDFACGVGQASTTLDVPYIGENQIIAKVTDRFGISSSEATAFLTVPEARPVLSYLSAWSGINVVYLNFHVAAVNGDHPRCEIVLTSTDRTIARETPCEGDVLTHVLDVPPGRYDAWVTAYSRAWHPPPHDMEWAGRVTVEGPPA